MYLTLKTLHIISIISWMAGLLYFYRLFVYHFEYGHKGTEVHELLSLMEKRLLRFITIPAMVLSVVTGLSLIALNSHYLSQTWLWIKLTGVIGLVFLTLNGKRWCRRFELRETQGYSSKKLRFINEIPTLLMIVIVAMVIFRPV